MTNASVVSFLTITLAALVLMWLERRYPYTFGQPLLRKGFLNDLLFYTIIQSYVLSLVISWITHRIDSLTSLSRFHLLTNLPVWSVVTLSLITHDFYIYWFHRWQHYNKYLWRIHEAHHSNEDVDWLAGSRSHALEILINQTVEFAPLALLGASPAAMITKGTVDAVWGMYIHSNIDVHSGPLQHVINGPEMHRWHHAREITDGGLNFSTKFAVWDWMFGTAYFPPGEKPQAFGVDGLLFPISYIRQQIFAFRKFTDQ